jgi:hypothetical protein
MAAGFSKPGVRGEHESLAGDVAGRSALVLSVR